MLCVAVELSKETYVNVVAVANQKGGVGKTALAANLAAALAERGHRVLLVDLDLNASLSSCMGYELGPDDPQIADVLDPERRLPMRQAIRPTKSPLVDVAPAEISLSVLEAALPLSQSAWPVRLREALAEVAGDYRVTIVDTHPSIGPLLTMAVVAADFLLAPVQTHHQARRAVVLLLDHVQRVRRRNGLLPLRYWIVRTMLRRGVAHDAEIAQILAEEYAGRILDTTITLSAVHADTSVPSAGGKTILWDFPRHPSADQYRMLAEEVERVVFPTVPARCTYAAPGARRPRRSLRGSCCRAPGPGAGHPALSGGSGARSAGQHHPGPAQVPAPAPVQPGGRAVRHNAGGAPGSGRAARRDGGAARRQDGAQAQACGDL